MARIIPACTGYLVLLLFLCSSRDAEGQGVGTKPRDFARQSDANRATDPAASPLNGRVLRGETTSIEVVAFSPDGTKVATFDGGGVRLWGAAGGDELHRLPHGELERFHAFAFSHDGKRLAASGFAGIPERVGGGMDMMDVENGGFILIWDINTGLKQEIIKGNLIGLATMSMGAGGDAISGLNLSDIFKTWDIRGGRKVLELDSLRAEPRLVPYQYCRFGLSSDADRAIGVGLSEKGRDEPIKLWDAVARRAWRLKSPVEAPRSVAISPDGGRFAVGGVDDTVAICDSDSGAELHRLRPERGGVLETKAKGLASFLEGVLFLAFSPDGKALVSAGRDAHVRVWDAETGRLVREVKGPKGLVRAVAFPPEGVRIASGGIEEIGPYARPKMFEYEPLTLWDIPLDRVGSGKR